MSEIKEQEQPKSSVSNLTFKKINVRIRGITPLLMNRLNPESLKSKGRMRMENYSVEQDAANSAYMAEIDGKKQLYIPQECVFSMFINTARQYRVRRTSLSSLMAGTLRVEPEKIPLGTDKYVIDSRAVVIQTQRVLKGRAKLEDWAAEFQLVYSTRLPEGIEATMKEILEDAGIRMGLLDYRPQHRGWFGTFIVEKFEPLPETFTIEQIAHKVFARIEEQKAQKTRKKKTAA